MKFDHFLAEHNFTRCELDPCVYLKKLPNGLILLLYVGHMLVTDTSKRNVHELKDKVAKKFETKYLGETKKILGMTITRDRKKREVMLSQKKYIDKVIERLASLI